MLLKYDAASQPPDPNPNATGSTLLIPEWVQLFNPVGGAEATVIASDGTDIYMAGRQISGTAGGQDIFFQKYDQTGNLLWNTTWGSGGDEIARGMVVTNCRIYITGYTNSFGAGGNDVFLLELDKSTGMTVSTQYWGGVANDGGSDIVVYDDELYIVGATASFGAGGADVLILKYDMNASCYPPIALDDTYAVDEDTTLIEPAPGVLANDTDGDNNPLTASLNSPPVHGDILLQSDGVFVYTPTLNFNGIDTFLYVVSDGVYTDTATATITVNAVNDPPIAYSDSYSTDEDNPLSIAVPGVLGNDTDVDGDVLTAIIDNGTANGTLSLAVDGGFIYTPTLNFNGSDLFTYHADDGLSASNVVTVSITIVAVNDAPVGVNDTAVTGAGMSVSIAVLDNDYDPDGDILMLMNVGAAQNGVTTVIGANVGYTPSVGFSGTDIFTYTISDGDLIAMAIVTVIVTPGAQQMLFLPIILNHP